MEHVPAQRKDCDLAGSEARQSPGAGTASNPGSPLDYLTRQEAGDLAERFDNPPMSFTDSRDYPFGGTEFDNVPPEDARHLAATFSAGNATVDGVLRGIEPDLDAKDDTADCGDSSDQRPDSNPANAYTKDEAAEL